MLVLVNKNNHKVPRWVTIKLTPEMNELLMESAIVSRRTKQKEIALRLEDHLIRYKAIAGIGDAITRNK